MQKQAVIPRGRKVRLLHDFPVDRHGLDIQPGDTIVLHPGELVRKQPRREQHVIARGMVGVVREGRYSSVFDYDRECPVQFGIDDPLGPKTIGIPWDLLEFVD